MADHFAILSQALTANFPHPVFVDLPHGFELEELPTIGLFTVGPAERRPGLNVLGVDVEDIDVDFFVSPLMWETGEAVKLANIVRLFLYRFRDGPVRVLDVSRPERRVDRNPKVRRLGMTVTFASPINESEFL
ncbi:hypothetical protein ACL1F6_08340 [Corynebacterium striatum]|uniref:hypothetical protein n=1 Tax=Corynebacterium striatum TaxID=43770 RepID=UPI001A24E9E7|nr:hypothetical protein [Corynebacterium striatum]HAT1303608.1 hypothetical protein [Corynebacterium striatum]HAT1392309.1 hypothetical protein [Corynebacterium striatum]